MHITELTLESMLEEPNAQERIVTALDKAGGDRVAAAAFFGVSYRTLQRAMLRLGMGRRLDVGARVAELLLRWGNDFDAGKAAVAIYGEDTRATRSKIYVAKGRALGR